MKRGAKIIILALDNDGRAGLEGTFKSIKRCWNAGLTCLVLQYPPGCKDADEYIRANGSDAFLRLVDKSIRGGSWIAEQILSKYDLSTACGQEKAIGEVITFDARMVNDSIESHNIAEILASSMNISQAAICERLLSIREREAREKTRQSLQMIAKDLSRLVEDGETTNAIDFVHDKLHTLRSVSATKVTMPYTLDLLRADHKQIGEGLMTGYSGLDQFLRIRPGTVNLVAGRPSHGKTTVLMNLFMNMVELYPDKRFYFYTYEEPRLALATKIIMRSAQTVIDSRMNYDRYSEYIVSGRVGRPEIDKAASQFDQLTKSGRLMIEGENFNIQELADSIYNLRSNIGPVGAVFIDYIQIIPAPGKWGTRQMQLQEVSRILKDVAKETGIPLVLGCQLSRAIEMRQLKKPTMADLRECGDFEQDASLVLAIWNKAMDHSKADDEFNRADDTSVEIFTLKNRNGAKNLDIKLRFNEPVLDLIEISTKGSIGQLNREWR